jgi:hypothetical protein
MVKNCFSKTTFSFSKQKLSSSSLYTSAAVPSLSKPGFTFFINIPAKRKEFRQGSPAPARWPELKTFANRIFLHLFARNSSLFTDLSILFTQIRRTRLNTAITVTKLEQERERTVTSVPSIPLAFKLLLLL